MKRFKEPKKRPAQQLVEFLLVAPFMIIILGILVEYAYALNVNMTINQGLKEVTSHMYSQIKPNASAGDDQKFVRDNLIIYLDDNNISTSTDNNLEVKYLTLGNTTVFTATYKYIPAFTLPTVYFKFIPDELNFFATSAVPTAFLNPNTYGTGIDNAALSGIWGAQNGVMNNAAAQGKMLFVVPLTEPLLVAPYQVKDWGGNVLYILDTDNGRLYNSCTAVTCTYSGQTFKDKYLSRNIVFVHDSSGGTWSDVRTRAIALANNDVNKTSLGNYDMSPSGDYITIVSDTNIFTYMSTTALKDNITNLK